MHSSHPSSTRVSARSALRGPMPLSSAFPSLARPAPQPPHAWRDWLTQLAGHCGRPLLAVLPLLSLATLHGLAMAETVQAPAASAPSPLLLAQAALPVTSALVPAAVTPFEASVISELQLRIAARSVELLRRAQIDGHTIELWLHPNSDTYFVSVSGAQGDIRRATKGQSERNAWLAFDEFRRLGAQASARLQATGEAAMAIAAPAAGAATPNAAGAAATNAAGAATPMAAAAATPIAAGPAAPIAAGMTSPTAAAPKVSVKPDATPTAPAPRPVATMVSAPTRPTPRAPAPAPAPSASAEVASSQLITEIITPTVTAGTTPVGPTAVVRELQALAKGNALKSIRRTEYGSFTTQLLFHAASGQYYAVIGHGDDVWRVVKTADSARALTQYDEFVRNTGELADDEQQRAELEAQTLAAAQALEAAQQQARQLADDLETERRYRALVSQQQQQAKAGVSELQQQRKALQAQLDAERRRVENLRQQLNPSASTEPAAAPAAPAAPAKRRTP